MQGDECHLWVKHRLCCQLEAELALGAIDEDDYLGFRWQALQQSRQLDKGVSLHGCYTRPRGKALFGLRVEVIQRVAVNGRNFEPTAILARVKVAREDLGRLPLSRAALDQMRRSDEFHSSH